VLFVRPTAVQEECYKQILVLARGSGGDHLGAIVKLKKVANHPELLFVRSEKAPKSSKKRKSAKNVDPDESEDEDEGNEDELVTDVSTTINVRDLQRAFDSNLPTGYDRESFGEAISCASQLVKAYSRINVIFKLNWPLRENF